ncbi:MAG: alpha/beta hydrolase family protein [Gammaproteobacteria bacterium]
MTRYIPLLLTLAAFPLHAFAHEPAPPGACHAGAYTMSDGSHLLIEPSDAPNLRYRFLNGRSGKLFPVAPGRYESGEGWSVREPMTVRVRFGACDEGAVRFSREGSPGLEGGKVPLPIRPIEFESGGSTFYGELVMPVRREPRAVVVLQYGSGRESAVVNNYVQYLLPLKDIAVFVFDKRGTGRSSGGYTIDIGTLADDMVAAVRAVRAQTEATRMPLGLMGESQGGWVAPLAARKLAVADEPVDFVVVSYGLAISMLEEDRQEVAQSLRAHGCGADVLAIGDEIHRAAARVMLSRFDDGLRELESLKAAWRDEPWFEHLGGDFTSVLASTPAERMDEARALFDFPYDLAYDPLPVIAGLTVPQLWILAGRDTEAPHESTLGRLRKLEERGLPIDISVFPDAEHGMIAVGTDEGAGHLAGRTVEGYFELLFDWIGRQNGSP